MDEIVVVGQIARDLVLVVDEVPGPGGTAPVRLVGVVGDDDVGERLVLDGSPERLRDELLACADVVRADHQEAELLSGRKIATADDAIRAARRLTERGPGFVAFAVDDVGNVFVWDEGELVVPLGDVEVVDMTDGGDAFVAALTFALTRGDAPADAARLAVQASGDTVTRPGGRPDLTGLTRR